MNVPTHRIESQPMIARKGDGIQAHFAVLLGETITRFETAELLLDDGAWGN